MTYRMVGEWGWFVIPWGDIVGRERERDRKRERERERDREREREKERKIERDS